MKDRREILFVCVHNAGRSQMAAALLDRHAGGAVHVRSAGSAPAAEINPAVVRGDGRDRHRPQQASPPSRLPTRCVREADAVVTMGCGDACPVYPAKRYLDWDLPDPSGRSVDDVRPIRDEIDRRVRALLRELVAPES